MRFEEFVGVYQGQIEGVGNVASRAAHIIHNRQVLMLVDPASAPPRGARIKIVGG